jgi:cation transporter-like permease
MELLEGVAQFRVDGGLVVAIVIFGCLVDGARLTAKASENIEDIDRPRPEDTMKRCAIALAAFGIFTVLAVLGGIVAAVLGLPLPPIVTTALFGAGAGLLAILIFGAVGVSKAESVETY